MSWTNAESYTFTSATTGITLEAWTACGKVADFSFTYAIYAISDPESEEAERLRLERAAAAAAEAAERQRQLEEEAANAAAAAEAAAAEAAAAAERQRQLDEEAANAAAATAAAVAEQARLDAIPTVKKACGTGELGDGEEIPQSFSLLPIAIKNEEKFDGFSAVENIVSPVGTQYCVDGRTSATDSFVRPSAAISSELCFHSLVKDVLSETAGTIDLSDTTKLVCTRCCSRESTIGVEAEDHSCLTQDGPTCSFKYCIDVPGSSLVSATAKVKTTAADATQILFQNVIGSSSMSSENEIHQAIPCTTFGSEDSACKFSTTLGGLIDVAAAWKVHLALDGLIGPEDLAKFDPDDYIAWRYKFGPSGDWIDWDQTKIIEFRAERTTIVVEAWTRCGRVLDSKTFVIVLHKQAKSKPCDGLSLSQATFHTTTSASSNSLCFYPRSDFAPLKLAYANQLPVDETTSEASDVRGTVNGVACTITVAPDTNVAQHDNLPLAMGNAPNYITNFGVDKLSNGGSFKTSVVVSCTISTSAYGWSSSTTSTTCPISASIVKCDSAQVPSCSSGTCKSPGSSTHGLLQLCGGSVFTRDSGKTSLKTWGSCCSTCGSASVSCRSLSSSVYKWCARSTDTSILMALATRFRDEPSGSDVAQMLPIASTNDESEGDKKGMEIDATITIMAVVVGSSFLGALAALIVTQRRADHPKAFDADAYLPLLE